MVTARVTAGQLRERVTIQSATETADGQGGLAKAWTALATVWANVVAAGPGRESLATSAVRPILNYAVTIRRRTDVTPQMRVVWGDKTLQVEGVRDPDGRRVWTTLDCVEGA